MSIDRPDWGAGGERGSGTAVTVHSGPYTELPSHDEVTTAIERGLPPTPQQQAAFAEFNKDSVPANRARDPETGRYVTRPDWNYDRTGREIVAESKDGLPADLVRDMAASAEGYDVQLNMMRASASRILAEMPSGFANHFESLSPGLKGKAFRALRDYSHLDVYRLVDKLQPTLTLSEMAEAQTWIKGLKR